MTGATPSHAWSLGDVFVIGIGVAGGIVAVPFVVSAGLGVLGFSTAGTAAGSIGAAFMSSYGGSIAAGSAVSVMQSAGAAGVGVAIKALGGVAGGAATYAARKKYNDN
ncbi:interferon alpha-inducible protein 27-like protein 1 [Mizuhopecten yessoensis]|uniref:interferon alpha-inducible protein 27-like protein 1 n=1 Tax=Mizuhopecten yessoensis TaxID=6573 RepID=UPI000B45B794|nr:interferon alpha-inducible protein 27-like protein 1 [Mizuhopecten yessoensis]